MGSTRPAMSRTGRWVALPHGDVIELINLLGTTPNRGLPTGGEAAEILARLR
jgi:hypothetical protein